MDHALQHNRQLRQLALAIDSSLADDAAVRAGYGFKLTPAAGARMGRDYDSATYGLKLTRETTLGTTLGAGVEHAHAGSGDDNPHTTGVRLEGSQPLFRRFGALPNREPLRRAASSIAAARRRYEARRADLVLEVAAAFEELTRLRAQLDFDREAVARADKLSRLTQARERLGVSSRVDTLRVDLQRGEAQSRLENNRERYASQTKDFAELLGADPDRTFTLAPPPELDYTAPRAETAVAIAWSNRLDYAQVWQDYRDARRGTRIARRERLPDLTLTARYEQYGTGSSSESLRLDRDDWYVGLSGDADVLQAAPRAAVRRAENAEETARLAIDELALAVRREVEQRLLAYRRALTDRSIAARNAELAVRRARLARRLYEAGRGDSFAATDAEAARAQAETTLLAARAEARLAVYRILRALGTLVEYPEELKPEEAIE